MASFWGGAVTCPACSFGAGIPLKYLQKNWNWAWWPPRCLQEPRVLLVGLLTGRVSGWLPLPKGEALCSCRGCSSNLWLVGEGRAAGHGLMAFFFLLFFLVESLSCFCHTNLSAPLEPCSWRRFLAWESSSRCLKSRTTDLCHPMQQIIPQGWGGNVGLQGLLPAIERRSALCQLVCCFFSPVGHCGVFGPCVEPKLCFFSRLFTICRS